MAMRKRGCDSWSRARSEENYILYVTTELALCGRGLRSHHANNIKNVRPTDAATRAYKSAHRLPSQL